MGGVTLPGDERRKIGTAALAFRKPGVWRDTYCDNAGGRAGHEGVARLDEVVSEMCLALLESLLEFEFGLDTRERSAEAGGWICSRSCPEAAGRSGWQVSGYAPAQFLKRRRRPCYQACERAWNLQPRQPAASPAGDRAGCQPQLSRSGIYHRTYPAVKTHLQQHDVAGMGEIPFPSRYRRVARNERRRTPGRRSM